MRLVLIRHGQSGNNLLFQQTGASVGRHPDTCLTELGHRQARLTADFLAGGSPDLPWRVTHLYTSLMTRAVQTAHPIGEALDLPLLPMQHAYEVGGPFCEDEETGDRSPYPGATRAMLAGLSERLRLPDYATDDGWYDHPYEEEQRAAERAQAVITRLRRAHADADDTVALVTHGFFTQYLFRELMGVSDMAGWIRIHNASLSLFEDGDWDGVVALRIGWTPHLSGDDISD